VVGVSRAGEDFEFKVLVGVTEGAYVASRCGEDFEFKVLVGVTEALARGSRVRDAERD
jgi:hypothetical protein